jgi:hypothetical protein
MAVLGELGNEAFHPILRRNRRLARLKRLLETLFGRHQFVKNICTSQKVRYNRLLFKAQ